MDLDGNTIKDAWSASQDAVNEHVAPDRRYFGFVLPRTAKDYKLEAAVDKLAEDWRNKYSIPDNTQDPGNEPQ